MTKERMIVFGVEDICSIRLRSKKFDGEVLVSMDRSDARMRDTCPWCEQRWSCRSSFDERRLFDAIQQLKCEENRSGVEIVFELKDKD